jgi:ribosome-associated translation inhibitor RaiA
VRPSVARRQIVRAFGSGALGRVGPNDAPDDAMEMQMEIAFRHMEKSPAVESFIRKWAAKLDTVYDRIERCDVVVEAPHLRHRRGNQYRVRIAMTVPGGPLVVSRDPGPSEAHEDVYVAVRDSFHTARRQLEDHVRRRLRAGT